MLPRSDTALPNQSRRNACERRRGVRSIVRPRRKARRPGRSVSPARSSTGGPNWSAKLEELLFVARARGLLEQAARSAAEVVQVDASFVGVLDDPFCELERLVDDRRADRGVLAHVVQDRSLGAAGDNRV